MNSEVFLLGLAVGVLGLLLLLSVLVAFAYNERSLLALAAYLSVMVLLVLSGERLQMGSELIQRLLLISGPVLIAGLQMWLLRNRTLSARDKTIAGLAAGTSLGLLTFETLTNGQSIAAGSWAGLVPGLVLAWGLVLAVFSFYLGRQSRDTAGPWRWWLLLGNGAGLAVALFFLTNLVDMSQTMRSYWPVVLMLLLQLPPLYLSLVWRSRLLNEIRLRSAAASTIDPLTGLATTPVLIERLMRIMSRAPQLRQIPAGCALFLIEVQNWNGLLNELGAEFNEKLLLEAALRLRRSIGDNDLAARIKGGRFAVVAQGLARQDEITTLATRLVVSGLRIDSPLLPGVEFKFHVIVANLKLSTPLALPATQAWLDSLADRFKPWPSSHRSRSILVVEDNADKAGRPEAEVGH